MMKTYLIFLFLTFPLANASVNPNEVMEKNEAARKIDQLQAKGKIIIDGGSRRRTEKTFTWWRKLQDNKVHYNTLTKFHTPATVKNQSILFLEAKDDKNEILMYLPTFKKTRIIESSQQNRSFMASDFSYSDITSIQNEDYNFSALTSSPCPNESTNKKLQCFQIVAVPKNQKAIERLGYSKIHLWIRGDNFMSDRIHYFNEKGKLFKELNLTKISKLSDGHFFSEHLKMQNVLNGQFTLIEFSDLDSKTNIPKNKFFKQRLGKE